MKKRKLRTVNLQPLPYTGRDSGQTGSDVDKAVLRPHPPSAGNTRQVILPSQGGGTADGVSVVFRELRDSRAELLLDFHCRWLPVLRRVKGSTYSSFNWPAGYLNHIEDVFTIAERLFPVVSESSSIVLEEALIALYFHDFERPVRYARNQGLPLPYGISETELGISSAGRQSFYCEVLPTLGIMLNNRELHALRYFHEADRIAAVKMIEGEALAGFCQMCDVLSHRKPESYKRSVR